MGIVIVNPPASEPLSLAEAKSHLRIDIADDDALVTDLITTARQMVENVTHRQLLAATLRMTLDKFPAPHHGMPWGAGLPVNAYAIERGHHPLAIDVERPPLRSVVSLMYVDPSGASVTMDPSTYVVDTDSEPGRIVPAQGCGWPGTQRQPNAVTIVYTAGFDDTDSRVKLAKMAMRQLISNWYENRSAVGSKLLGVEVPFAAQSLLDSLMWGDYR